MGLSDGVSSATTLVQDKIYKRLANKDIKPFSIIKVNAKDLRANSIKEAK